ncbi:hypothetical protein QF047_001463 [Arthrobacter sp. W4I7]|nr:hypothetical protein [Arthrobacter sp. W4I7]
MRHLLQGHAQCLGGVAAQVLVREEQHPLAALERPLQDGFSVRGGADDAAVLAAESLQGCGGIHVGDRDDRNPAFGVGLGAEDLLKLLPALGHGVGVSHVRHGAAGRQVGQDDSLFGRGEDVSGFGHEVDAAEHDGLGVRPRERGVGQLEGVAHEVRVLDDFVALVKVPQDDGPVAQYSLGG